MSGKAKDSFTRMAARDAAIRREGLPDPKDVAEAGIKTKESLAWLEADKQAPPRPELNADDQRTREDAEEDARTEKQTRARSMRQRFEGRGRKGRNDFETARKYRGRDYER